MIKYKDSAYATKMFLKLKTLKNKKHKKHKKY